MTAPPPTPYHRHSRTPPAVMWKPISPPIFHFRHTDCLQTYCEPAWHQCGGIRSLQLSVRYSGTRRSSAGAVLNSEMKWVMYTCTSEYTVQILLQLVMQHKMSSMWSILFITIISLTLTEPRRGHQRSYAMSRNVSLLEKFNILLKGGGVGNTKTKPTSWVLRW